ncbi:MAG: hypothetical protein HYY58_01615, partial [Candidatus Omnitrophica bacterium]|nr:hypothetical protein [Candidatus Omnitrophota bacterium]
MVAFKETAEEHLLRMIEGPRGADPPGKPTPASVLSQLKDRAQGLMARLWGLVVPARRGRYGTDTFLWNLRLASRLLWVVLAGLGTYVVLDLLVIQPKPRPGRILAIGNATTASEVSPANPADSLQPLADYLASVTQYNPFTGAAQGRQAAPVIKTTKRRLEELASGLMVVGIDRGPNPVALIEHSAQQRTYTVKVGDEINGMIVKEISSEG